MLIQCWASVEDGGPTLNQHCVNVPCLLGWNVSRAGTDIGTDVGMCDAGMRVAMQRLSALTGNCLSDLTCWMSNMLAQHSAAS